MGRVLLVRVKDFDLLFWVPWMKIHRRVSWMNPANEWAERIINSTVPIRPVLSSGDDQVEQTRL